MPQNLLRKEIANPIWNLFCSPRFGIAHALCLGLAPWLAAEVPILVDSGMIKHKDDTTSTSESQKVYELLCHKTETFDLVHFWVIGKINLSSPKSCNLEVLLRPPTHNLTVEVTTLQLLIYIAIYLLGFSHIC